MTRHVSSIIATLKAALGIVSPSRAFADLRWDKLTIDGEPWPPATRTVLTLPPWYAARGPLEPYETPELAAAARRVRRLIRRHWWALFFEPEISTAVSVLEAMATPPECVQPAELFNDTRARAERAAYVALVGAT